MTPALVDFVTFNNEAFAEGWTLRFAGSTPFSFADYAPLRMMVRAEEFSSLAELDLTDSDALSHDGDGGLSLLVEDVSHMLGTYFYDLRGTDSGGNSVVLQYGTVTVEQGKTWT